MSYGVQTCGLQSGKMRIKNRCERANEYKLTLNSIKEQNNLQNKHALQKKTNLEKHFGILFSARLYRTDVETYNIQRERDGYTYIWVIFFIDGLENNLHELLYYNIFLVYPPFAYAIRSLAHMELLSCHGPRQPLEGAHGHMSSVLLHVA